MMNLTRKFAAEFIGTMFLLAVVVGSGIMGERLANGNNAVALLANTIATGAGLIFLILTFSNISGSHFNPVVSFTEAWQGNIGKKDSVIYLLGQICGAICGVATANVMFELPIIHASTKIRTGFAQWVGEFIATFGLIMVIRAGSKFHASLVPFMVAAYITSAYWFTSSTSFANPAVTIARSMSDTFAGIRPFDVLPFIIAQVSGAIAATFLFNWLLQEEKK
jgi:glycerol uptake facilitator-like aquaporin